MLTWAFPVLPAGGGALIQADQQPLICLLGSRAAGDSPRSACDCFTSQTNPSICVERSWWQRMRFPAPHPSSAYTKGGAAGTGCVSISRMVEAEPASVKHLETILIGKGAIEIQLNCA